jgi:hypothetical protein
VRLGPETPILRPTPPKIETPDILNLACKIHQPGECPRHRAPDGRVVGVGVLTIVDELVNGGQPGPEQGGTDQRSRARESPPEEVPLHPANSVEVLEGPVRLMRLEEGPPTVIEAKPEGGSYAQLAQEDLLHPRSEVCLAEGIEPISDLLGIGGAEERVRVGLSVSISATLFSILSVTIREP